MSEGENARLIRAAGLGPTLEAETLSLVATAERMARYMGCAFVVDPEKLARYGNGPRPSKETGDG